jgi:hypothetical protein
MELTKGLMGIDDKGHGSFVEENKHSVGFTLNFGGELKGSA